MSTPTVTPNNQTLAQMIRAKYPDAYKDMDDAALEQKILDKYPQYGNLPRTSVKPAEPSEPIGTTGFENYQAPPIGNLAAGALKSLPFLSGGLTGFEQGPKGFSSGDELNTAMTHAEAPQGTAEKAGSIIGTTAQMLPWAAAGVPKAAQAVSEAIPSAARAGENFQSVMQVAKSQKVPITDALSGALSRYQELIDAGGSRSVAVGKFLNRVTNPDMPAMTYKEARDFYSNISRLSADETRRLTPVMKQQIGTIRAALNDAIQQTANAVDRGSQYAGAMKEYAKAARWSDLKEGFIEQAKSKLPWLATAFAGKKIYDTLSK